MIEKAKFRITRKTYFLFYSMALTLIILIFIIILKRLPLNKIALGGAGVFILGGLLITETKRLKQSYEVTGEFVVHSIGYISKKVKKILIESIMDIDVKQGIIQRILNFGDLRVHASDGSNIIHIHNVTRPHRLANLLEKRINEKLNRYGE